MTFEFSTAQQIIFGSRSIGRVEALVKGWGTRALVVTGTDPACVEILLDQLRQAGVSSAVLPVVGEPDFELVRKGVSQSLETRAAMVLAIGGGSALDVGKAVAALSTNPGDPMDFAEVIGAGKTFLHAALPLVAIPTTSGTGSEATRNAVLKSREHGMKVSLRSPYMLPRVALIDPDLTRDLPPAIRAATSMDALAQLIEPYVSCRANPMSDALCREGILRAARSLEKVCFHPDDAAAREDMALASLFSGMALANAGLGAVHGFAAALGGMLDIPHGVICAVMLAPIMQANARALISRTPTADALTRYNEVGRMLTGLPSAGWEDGVEWVRTCCARLTIPSLQACGLARGQFETVVKSAATSSSMKGNPLPLTEGELLHALNQAYGGLSA